MLQASSALRNPWVWIALGVVGVAYFFGDTLDMGFQAVTSDDSFTQWDALFQKYGSQYNVPWRWMKAICMNESSLGQDSSVQAGMRNPGSDDGWSSDGLSRGLMQMTLKTAQALMPGVSVAQLDDPDTNVRLSGMLLAQLIGQFGMDDRESVIRAYNGGPKFGAATLPYYTKFVAHLAIVMAHQPGDELET